MSGPFQIPLMRVAPQNMPAGTDGQAHLFFTGAVPVQFMATSTTGCIAVRSPDEVTRIHKWYFRAKEKDPIEYLPVPWLIVWSCRAPWNDEPCGHITRLNVVDCELNNIHIGDLQHLAHLRCNGNMLEHLDCSGLSCLRDIDCSHNDLISFDTSNCPRLRSVRAFGNPRLRQRVRDAYHGVETATPLPRHRVTTATSLIDLLSSD